MTIFPIPPIPLRAITGPSVVRATVDGLGLVDLRAVDKAGVAGGVPVEITAAVTGC